MSMSVILVHKYNHIRDVFLTNAVERKIQFLPIEAISGLFCSENMAVFGLSSENARGTSSNEIFRFVDVANWIYCVAAIFIGSSDDVDDVDADGFLNNEPSFVCRTGTWLYNEFKEIRTEIMESRRKSVSFYMNRTGRRLMITKC